MPLELARWFSFAFAVYAVIGFVFAIAFVWRGAGRIDPVAQSGTLGFRILLVPGAAALWPLLLRRWLGARSSGFGGPPEPTDAHHRAVADRAVADRAVADRAVEERAIQAGGSR